MKWSFFLNGGSSSSQKKTCNHVSFIVDTGNLPLLKDRWNAVGCIITLPLSSTQNSLATSPASACMQQESRHCTWQPNSIPRIGNSQSTELQFLDWNIEVSPYHKSI